MDLSCVFWLLDTCSLTDGSTICLVGISFPAPPRSSLGWAKTTCHIAMFSRSGSPLKARVGSCFPGLQAQLLRGLAAELGRDMCLSPSELSGLSVLTSLLPSPPPSSLLSPLVGDVFETYHCIAQASLELTVVQAGFQLKVLLTQC